jgi:26S proteasome regulatory subunit N12
MAQVKTCYSDYASVLPSSPLQFQLQGLNLMFLLANSKIAEFHTELELIQVGEEITLFNVDSGINEVSVLQVDQWENPFVHFPIKLEQYLMEGSYQKVKDVFFRVKSSI